MNRIRAYFDRIQGRLLVALTLGALGMVAIFVVSYRTLDGFSESIGNELSRLQDRMELAMRLEGAVADQIAAAQLYVGTGDGAALAESAELAAGVREMQGRLVDLVRNAGGDGESLQQISAIISAHNDGAAGNREGACGARRRPGGRGPDPRGGNRVADAVPAGADPGLQPVRGPEGRGADHRIH
jgi:hypothetical protein